MDVREAYLNYFESKQHQRIEGAPLVPEDATLLFNNAGMVPFKSIFTGEVPPPHNPRATSCQPCLRAGGKHNDLENVGHTARHHTFFEMLGNFSFGDYFKEEAIAYAWEFITEVLELPVERLWVTVHESDDEAEAIWKKHIAPDRIKRLGDADNFWQMGDTGPCGPCSEIFYDQGAEYFHSEEDYLGGEGDRFLEIWNLVFMQYERNLKGEMQPLPRPSIDTGMGLERVVAIKEGVRSNYDSSLFMPLIHHVERLLEQPYVYESGASYRVIADHIRTVVFLLAQGTNFANEGRGYVLRRILRRAVRHGYLLGLKEPFMYTLVAHVVTGMNDAYPYLEHSATTVAEQIRLEEERFFKTIASGIALFNEELQQTREVFSGEVAFKLYDTFGFPLDLTEDMLKENNLTLDSTTFNLLMSEQRERAKAAWKGSGDSVAEGDFKTLLERFGTNTFVGYDTLKSQVNVKALLSENFRHVDALHARQKGWVLLEQTPFYAQSGGQCGDSGVLAEKAAVLDTRLFHGLNLSHVAVHETLSVGETLEATVDDRTRNEIAKHHSATHLMHAALYDVLGDHISQAGSLVEATRLRFDFSHPKAMTSKEILAVEEWVNEKIVRGIARQTQEMAIDEAKRSGAKALFGEKYGDRVRVVSFEDASVELCGGTHVDNTAAIGMFLILKESGVSAGVRRIEAVCGYAAYHHVKGQRQSIEAAQQLLKSRDLLSGIERLKEQTKTLKADLHEALQTSKETLNVQEVDGVALIVEVITGGDIKERIDELKNAHERIAVMLFQVKGSKVLMAAGIKNAPLKAGAWIKEVAPLLGGGGGGRDDFAQAGGKTVDKIDEAKALAWRVAHEALV
ncbi:MAG: alanine--tRNA ligase [Sulfurimonas sp.]|nr:MAG: alanine--tRNA ligase [Sulfurimonas sp.]